MIKKLLFGILIFISLFIYTSYFTVEENEIAYLTQFGKVSRIIEEPGLNFKVPFIQSVNRISKKLQHYDAPVTDIITKDKKSMICDNFIIWKVKDPLKFIRTLNANINRANERIEAAVYNAIKASISSMTQDEVIASRGSLLTDIITKESNSDIGSYGLYIEKVEIKQLDLPNDNKEAVYKRMISERNNNAAALWAEGQSDSQKIKNKTDRAVKTMIAEANQSADIIIANGESEYMRILNEFYNDKDKADFYIFVRGLDSLKESFKGTNKTIILDKDSDIVKLLYNK